MAAGNNALRPRTQGKQTCAAGRNCDSLQLGYRGAAMPILQDDWDFVLGPGSMFDRLRRDPRVQVDPHIFNAALIYDDGTRQFLADTLHEYIDIAQHHGLPYLASTVTWRASAERVALSRCAGRPVNRDCAEFALELRDNLGPDAAPMVVAGCMGPKGDAYKPAEAPPREGARRFHNPQITELADTALDCLEAKTLPAMDEAIGIADAMAETGKPYILSFVVLPTGTLLDGTPFGDAITRIDDTVTRPPDHYMVNCVHARNYAKAFQIMRKTHPSACARVIGLEANTSVLTPEELDNRAEVDTQEPDEFGAEVWSLRATTGARYLAGCCGSGTEHIDALAQYAKGQKVAT